MWLEYKKLTTSGFVVSVLATMIGCGGPYDSSVEGVVTLNGDPVASGAVAFIPAGGGPPAYALTDAAGKYEVYTGSEAGLSSGAYGVTVVAREPPKEKQSKLGGPPKPGKQLTPPWYGSSKATPLNFDVKPGSNDIDLELNSDPPPDWNPPRRRR